jgi:hypothetical protein
MLGGRNSQLFYIASTADTVPRLPFVAPVFTRPGPPPTVQGAAAAALTADTARGAVTVAQALKALPATR